MITHVHSVGIVVRNIERLLPFYMDGLGFEADHSGEIEGAALEQLTGAFGARAAVAELAIGDERVQLYEFVAPPGGRRPPQTSRGNDLWFQHIALIVADMDAAYDTLATWGIQHVSTRPQTLPAALPHAAGIRAFYFRDRDGHNLELLAFPPNKGAARWHNPPDDVPLPFGIDHTAIAVADTDRSIAFYAGLGLTVAGQGENFGIEQAHLNMVEGAHLRITGLAAPGGGMGVELLHYLHPGPGRPYPAGTAAHDLWAWTTNLVSDDITADHARLNPTAPLVTLPPGNPFGWARAFRLSDPDGHRLMIVEPSA